MLFERCEQLGLRFRFNNRDDLAPERDKGVTTTHPSQTGDTNGHHLTAHSERSKSSPETLYHHFLHQALCCIPRKVYTWTENRVIGLPNSEQTLK